MNISVSLFYLVIWLISLVFSWEIFNSFFNTFERVGKYFIYYFLISLWILILLDQDRILQHDIRMHLLSEIIGICIMVLLVERVSSYISKKNERTYQKLMLRTCKMQILEYFRIWHSIYKMQDRNDVSNLSKYKNLDEYLFSEIFYTAITNFNFINKRSDGTFYAKLFYDKHNEINNRFQNTLAKYGSKLTLKDIKLLEYFGGTSFISTIILLMNEVCETESTFLNLFQKVSHQELKQHFKTYIDLVNDYNNALDTDDQPWTLNSLVSFDSIESLNISAI